MNRNQYRLLTIALFLLALELLFPPRNPYTPPGQPLGRFNDPPVHRGFLFGDLYLEGRARMEGTPAETISYDLVQLDFQRLALETLLLASLTGFALLILRSSPA